MLCVLATCKATRGFHASRCHHACAGAREGPSSCLSHPQSYCGEASAGRLACLVDVAGLAVGEDERVEGGGVGRQARALHAVVHVQRRRALVARRARQHLRAPHHQYNAHAGQSLPRPQLLLATAAAGAAAHGPPPRSRSTELCFMRAHTHRCVVGAQHRLQVLHVAAASQREEQHRASHDASHAGQTQSRSGAGALVWLRRQQHERHQDQRTSCAMTSSTRTASCHMPSLPYTSMSVFCALASKREHARGNGAGPVTPHGARVASRDHRAI